jgi:hypothetical protein
LSLSAYDVDGLAYTNLITLTANNAPTLALTSTGVGTLNNISIGATTPSTGAFTTLSASGTTTLSGNQIISVTDNTNAALRITQLGTGNALLVEDISNPDATPFVIDTNGNTLVNATSAVAGFGGITSPLQVNNGGGIAASFNRFSADGNDASIQFLKSRNATYGSQTIVQSGDNLGAIRFTGSDGSAFLQAATITAASDGTPGLNDMPGRLVFSTTADGASSPTERFRIGSAGQLGINGATYGTSGQVLTSGGNSAAPTWTTPTTGTGTVTSVSGTGTVSGITLSGTVTTSGNLSLGGTLDLSSPPSIGNTSANTGAFTSLGASGVVTLSAGTANGIVYLNGSNVVTTGTAFAFDGVSVTSGQFLDTGFTLADNTDITKKAVFELSGITTATTRTYTLPDVTGTVALTSGVQTFSSSTTFSGTTINITASTQALNLGSSNTSGVLTLGGASGTGIITLGRSTLSQTTNIQAGATASGSTKTINLGTAGLSGSISNINIGSAVSGATTNITLSGTATMSGPVINNGYTEQVFAVTGTTPALSPTNGSIQTWTLSGNSTPTSGTWANGQSLTLMVDDGTAFTITWTSLAVTWETNAGTAPTLSITGYTVIQLWKVGGVIFGARVGDA